MCQFEDSCANYRRTANGKGCWHRDGNSVLCFKEKTAIHHTIPCNLSNEAPGSATKPGLTEAETSEYNDLLIKHIGEVTQEDWLRLHELNDRYIEALRG